VALCFLSSLNHDTYTRRSFQIPAMKVAMLSQYSDDLATLFEPDREAVFFRDQRELLDNLARLLGDEVWRQSVAEAGYAKVYSAGHDVGSRMRVWLQDVQQHRNATTP
jgi:spore maturation protein CgeB